MLFQSIRISMNFKAKRIYAIVIVFIFISVKADINIQKKQGFCGYVFSNFAKSEARILL